MDTSENIAKSLTSHKQNVYGQIPSGGLPSVPREGHLKNIENYLKGNVPVVVISGILGISGSGKTTVARQYVEKHKSHYEGVVWVNHGSFKGEINCIFDVLPRNNEDNVATKSDELRFDNWIKGKHLPESQKQSNLSYLRYLLDILPQWFSKSLLVIDDADGSIIDFLNGLSQFDKRVHIVVTTRIQKYGRVHNIVLTALSSEESLRVFKNLIGNKVSQEPEAAVQLAELLKGFPLAISHVCKYINEHNISISDYIKIYKEGGPGLGTQGQNKQLIVLAEKVLKEGDLNTVERFLEQLKQIVLPYARSPLFYATANPNTEVIEYLMDALNLEPDEETSCGITPLLRAAFYGNLKAIELFLKLGADPTRTDTLHQDIIGVLKRQNHHRLIEPVQTLIKETERVRKEKASGISIKRRKFSTLKVQADSEVKAEAQPSVEPQPSTWSMSGLLSALSFFCDRPNQSQYRLLPTEGSVASPTSTDKKLKT